MLTDDFLWELRIGLEPKSHHLNDTGQLGHWQVVAYGISKQVRIPRSSHHVYEKLRLRCQDPDGEILVQLWPDEKSPGRRPALVVHEQVHQAVRVIPPSLEELRRERPVGDATALGAEELRNGRVIVRPLATGCLPQRRQVPFGLRSDGHSGANDGLQRESWQRPPHHSSTAGSRARRNEDREAVRRGAEDLPSRLHSERRGPAGYQQAEARVAH
mmetsp:Transcript_68316/g.148730  ORF Transcript_68316/g.148730 Transcript_68316/m.148730 type:complete len:215 (+) Transcript_68316:226-870(+)